MLDPEMDSFKMAFGPELPPFVGNIELHDQKTEEANVTAGAYYSSPTRENKDTMLRSYSDLAVHISDELAFVMNNEEYSNEEKARMSATILIRDDQRRVTELNKLCKGVGTEVFKHRYPDVNDMPSPTFYDTSDRIQELLDLDNHPDDIVTIISDTQSLFMKKDLDKLVRIKESPTNIEEEKWDHTIEEIKRLSKQIRLGAMAAGAIITKLFLF